MTDSNYTHILAIADRSGSMGWNGADKRMASALNEYFAEQALVEGKCLVDYYQFDTNHELVFEDERVDKAKAEISPRGGTALLDAIGFASTNLGKKLKALPEAHRPGKVLVVVVTDGEENSSREWTADKVKELIKRQENKYSWDYVFLGANIDAVAVGQKFGFKGQSSITYDIYSDAAVGATSASLSNYTTTYRGGGAGAFSDDDRKKALAKS